ncbi:hypothetical protein [Halorarum salinum]|uniref:hypothetical protein n=1 Tax=Halorarum salinum TaxID=2743089 RepID=UPI001FE95E99|nr:hypothetical protein [Halobaculum salinum]
MGRTNPTYRNFLESYESEWAPFRRALRRQYRSDFDRLFERAAEHAGAAGMQNPPDPTEALLLSLSVAHEAELRRLRDRVEALEAEGTPEDGGTSEGAGPSERGEDGP